MQGTAFEVLEQHKAACLRDVAIQATGDALYKWRAVFPDGYTRVYVELWDAVTALECHIGAVHSHEWHSLEVQPC